MTLDKKYLFYMLALILYTSIFQIFLFQIYGSYVSLATILNLFAFFFLFFYNKLLLFKWRPILFLIFLMFFQVLSILWSIDIKLALKSISNSFIFIVLANLAFLVSYLESYEKILHLLRIYFTLLLVLLFLVIVFRLFPQLESLFLHSDISKIFINPNIINHLFDTEKNNVLDPLKSGAFFVNGNVAAAFMGINSIIAFGLYKAYNIKFFLKVAISLAIGVIFTGSKAGLLLLVFFIFLYFLSFRFSYLLIFKKKKVIFLIIIILLFLFPYIDIFLNHLIHTLTIRVQIWNYALESFLDRPFLGEGFGGWQVGFAKYALEHNIVRVFPPHNTFIYLWSQSGIVVVILAIFFILSIIQYAFKLLNSKNRELIGLGIALLGSFLWTFIHGMGTNFGLVGESHMEVILATILGYSYARFKISKDKNEK